MRASCPVVGARPAIVTRGNARAPRGLPYAEPVLLSDRDIRAHVESGRLGIDPFDPQMVQPSSVDVRLDGLFRVFNNTRYTHIDPKQRQDELTSLVEPAEGEPFVLHPGEFVLASTLECFTLPADLAGRQPGLDADQISLYRHHRCLRALQRGTLRARQDFSGVPRDPSVRPHPDGAHQHQQPHENPAPHISNLNDE